MSNELRTDKFCTGIAFTYETKAKMMLKFAKDGEKFPSVVRRVCEDLVADVKLPKSVVDEINRMIKDNYDRRMATRETNALHKGKLHHARTFREK